MKTQREIYEQLLNNRYSSLINMEDSYSGQNKARRLANTYAVKNTQKVWKSQFPEKFALPVVKSLALKFSYPGLLEICTIKGWKIPSKDEVMVAKIELIPDWVWISEEPTHDNQDGTRRVLYNKKTNTTKQVHKDWLEYSCVIKQRN